MARPPHPGPTERELTLLNILWERHPLSIKQIRDAFPHQPRPAHTSLQTNLQGMLDKGYVTRDATQHTHLYAPAITRAEVEGGAIRTLLGQVFGGSTTRLLTSALNHHQPTPEELHELQALLDRYAQRE